MTREQVYQRVVELIQDEKGEDFQVQPESTLADNIAADSVEIMEFVLNLEDEFHVDVPDAAIEHFEVLSDIVDFIYEEVKTFVVYGRFSLFFLNNRKFVVNANVVC